MTEDDMSRWLNQTNVLTGTPFEPVTFPSRVESAIATLPTGENGTQQLWKLSHYYERLDDWNAAQGVRVASTAGPAAEALFELHDLTADPAERHNRVDDAVDALSTMQTVLESEGDAKRLLSSYRNPEG